MKIVIGVSLDVTFMERFDFMLNICCFTIICFFFLFCFNRICEGSDCVSVLSQICDALNQSFNLLPALSVLSLPPSLLSL